MCFHVEYTPHPALKGLQYKHKDICRTKLLQKVGDDGTWHKFAPLKEICVCYWAILHCMAQEKKF